MFKEKRLILGGSVAYDFRFSEIIGFPRRQPVA